jgi:predicted dehydrogenase
MSDHQTVRIGIIGRGFGARVVAPTFDKTEGCEVVDVVSPRDEAAVAALCARGDVDLISVHSPPFLHLDHVRRATGAGRAVACDKPFGRNADEARAMVDLARESEVVNLVNFEFRYDPVRQELRRLVLDGAIGEPQHFSTSMFLATSRSRPHGWLFDRDLGGGWIGALGSHLVDFVRWTFGEVATASAERRTTITERPDGDGAMQPSTAEDGFVATLRSASGVTIVLDTGHAAPLNLPPRTRVVGTEGVLETEADQRIILRTADGVRQDFDPNPEGADVYALPMQRWAVAVRDAVRKGAVGPDTPTFADGLATALVMDELRR